MTVGASDKGAALRPAIAARPSPLQRLRYNLRIAASQPTTLVGVLMAALFAYLIVVPIIAMLLDSVQVQLGDERRIKADVGSLTWYYLERTFSSRVAHSLFWGPLVNTLSVAVGAIVAAMLVGGTLAWLLSRTDMFGRKLVRDRTDRALHAPGLDLCAGLDDAFQESHRRRTGGLVRVARADPAGLARLWPPAGHDHPGAALRPVHHPALRQRAAPLRQSARGFGANSRGRATDGHPADRAAADAARR